MGKKRTWYFDVIPRWLLYSGLPEELNERLGPDAWLIFQCLIHLDCRFNRDHPGTFDQSFEEIASLVGKSRKTVWKYVKALERDNRIWVRRGISKRRKSTFKITCPIKTPKRPKDIHALDGGLLNRKGKRPNLRYAEPVTDGNGLNWLPNGINRLPKRHQPVTIGNTKERKREEKRITPETKKEAQAPPSSLSQGEGERLLGSEEFLRRSKAFREDLKAKLRRKELEAEKERLEKRKSGEEEDDSKK